jgi:hypothetical protein
MVSYTSSEIGRDLTRFVEELIFFSRAASGLVPFGILRRGDWYLSTF